MIHLDTSFLVRALVPGSQESEALTVWIQRAGDFAISAITWAEFLSGPLTESDWKKSRQVFGDVVPVGEGEAVLAAHLFNATGRRRGSLADSLIAANAIRAHAGLATANPKDFERFKAAGLRLTAYP